MFEAGHRHIQLEIQLSVGISVVQFNEVGASYMCILGDPGTGQVSGRCQSG